jgi:hypothetical protein
MGNEGAAGLWLDGTREHSTFESRSMIKKYGIIVLLRPPLGSYEKLSNLVICLMTLFGSVVATVSNMFAFHVWHQKISRD